jgi:hypothetical protein
MNSPLNPVHSPQTQQQWASHLRQMKQRKRNRRDAPEQELERIITRIKEHTDQLRRYIDAGDPIQIHISLGKLYRLRAQQVRALVARDTELLGSADDEDVQDYVRAYYHDCDSLRAAAQLLVNKSHGSTTDQI